MKRTKLKRQATDRQREERAYNKRLPAWKAEHPFCEACAATAPYKGIWEEKATIPRATMDCHHKAGRVHGLLLMEEYWVPVCRSCHNWIGSNGRLARKLGLVIDLPVEMGLKTR